MDQKLVKIALQAYESWMKSFRCPKGWLDIEENRKKIGEVLLEHVENTGTADARDVADVYQQLVDQGVEFDINWGLLVPHPELGVKNMEEADRFVKKNAERFSTNPTLLNKINEVLAFCQAHNLHEEKKPQIDPDTQAWLDAIEETNRIIAEYKPSDVRQTYSSPGNSRIELFHRKIVDITRRRDELIRIIPTWGKEGILVKHQAQSLVKMTRQYAEASFDSSPLRGA